MTAPARRCQRCGQTDDTVSTHSNVDECGRCWTHRKLDLPAAEHWAKAAQTFLSNVDYHDLTSFLPRAIGDAGEPTTAGQLLRAAQAVMVYSERLVNEGPPHVWREAAGQAAETSSDKIN